MRLSSLPQLQKDGVDETHPLELACMKFVLRPVGCSFVANLGTVMRFVCTDHQNIYGVWRHSDGMSRVKSSDSLRMARQDGMVLCSGLENSYRAQQRYSDPG